ncbi:MAG TPA: HAMP domain-containing sensor histidine kinase [Acidimicrobiales bacterium]|nr:HAMP domain-containing sensor histidine kinase [Acidimicrobiales bacterium]
MPEEASVPDGEAGPDGRGGDNDEVWPVPFDMGPPNGWRFEHHEDAPAPSAGQGRRALDAPRAMVRVLADAAHGLGRWPLRRRLAAVVAIVLIAGLAGADAATYRTLRSYLAGQLQDQLTNLTRSVGRIAGRGNLGTLGGPLRFAGEGQGAYVAVVDPSGEGVQGSVPPGGGVNPLAPPKLPNPLPAPPAPPANGDPFAPGSGIFISAPSTQPGSPPFRLEVSALPFGEGTLVVGIPEGEMLATLHRLLLTELAVSLAAVACAAVLGAWLVRLGLRPLEDMAATAGEIASARLDRRVSVANPDTEVGQLGEALNAMLGRIEGAFAEQRASEERLRRFVADASHELRTPLTSIRGYAELFRRGADRRPDDLAKVMHRIESEALNMSLLVEDLLLLARIDQGRPLERNPVDLQDLVHQAADAARAVEPDRPIELEADEAVTVLGDQARLRQVLDNLLSNVRTHTPPGTPARVSLHHLGPDALIEVTDEGPGLGPEVAARAFERFYRADQARSHDQGSVGLGLSIVEAIAHAHGGSVGVASEAGRGARFWIRIPCSAPGTSSSPNGLTGQEEGSPPDVQPLEAVHAVPRTGPAGPVPGDAPS